LSDLRRIAGFFTGLFIVLVCGWGLIAGVGYVAYKSGWAWAEPADIAAIAGLLVLPLFLLLERNFWLSRLMGLRVRPGAAPWRSAVMMWLFGVAWLFVKASIIDAEVVPADRVAAQPKPKPHPRDSLREVVETVVFVVALVLMLKLFVVEAFVIPTGSMAETLYGYNKLVTCEECGFEFPVNASDEADPPDGVKKPVTAACCPNCRHWNDWGHKPPAQAYAYRSGDRVLVHKALYHFTDPHRGHVVVFKFPVDPQVNHTAQNYIKRLWGLGGETLAIYRGDLYLCRDLAYPEDAFDSNGYRKYPRPKPEEMDRLWEGQDVDRHSKTRPPYQSLHLDFTYHNADIAQEAFEASRPSGFSGGPGRFELIRKSDDLAMSMRRIVYDNDHQSITLAKKGVPSRWNADGNGWTADNASMPKVFTHSGDGTGWVRYLHRIPGHQESEQQPVRDAGELGANGYPRPPLPADWVKVTADGYKEGKGMFEPTRIGNFLGYNSGFSPAYGAARMSGEDYWVGDLMAECEARVSGPADEVVLELSKGVDRFQARFANGSVTLVRLGAGGGDMATKPTGITGGSHKLRFANFDYRLRVWVDGEAIDFGAAADYPPGPAAGDKTGLGSLAAVAAVTGVALPAPRPDGHTVPNDVFAPAGIGARGSVEVSHVVLWMDTFFTPADGGPVDDKPDTFYVQPGHYLCLGDNSGQSSDSRRWGLVPERLMLGRAVFVFFPIDRIGFIR
jgi:signal peptidase I